MSVENLCDCDYTQVPSEIWRHIFAMISGGDKIAVSRSCRFFYNVANDEELLPERASLAVFVKSFGQLIWAASSAKTSPLLPMNVLGKEGTPSVLRGAIKNGFLISKSFLWSVVSGDNIEMFKYLASEGYYSRIMKDTFRLAILHTSRKVAEYLMFRLNYTEHDWEFLYFAIRNGKVEILDHLWGNRFRDPDFELMMRIPMLSSAAAKAGQICVLDYFFEVLPEDGKRFVYSSMVLSSALKKRNFGVANYLLSKGSVFQRSAGFYPITHRQHDVLNFLRDKGYNLFSQYCDMAHIFECYSSILWLKENNFLCHRCVKGEKHFEAYPYEGCGVGEI